MSMILGSSPSSLFAGRTAVSRSSHSRKIVLAATGPKSKTTRVRQTKKIEIDEDTSSTIGAAGIFGVAVATAGFLFVNSGSVVYEPAAQTMTEAAAPTPMARSSPLPAADTGAKVKPSTKAEASVPVVAKKEAVKEEPKYTAPEAPKYVPPPAIKAEKAGSASTFGAPKTAPAVKSSSSSAAEPASSPSPTVIGGAVLALAAAAAVAAGSNNSETSEGSSSAPAAPMAASSGVPAGAAYDAGREERIKDRQMWIAAWKAKI